MLQGEAKMAEIHIQTKVANINSTPPSQPSSFSLCLLSSLVFRMCLSRLIPNSVWVLPQVQDANSGEDCCLCTLPLHSSVYSSQCQSPSTLQLITLARWLAEGARTEKCEGQAVRMRERLRWTKGNVNKPEFSKSTYFTARWCCPLFLSCTSLSDDTQRYRRAHKLLFSHTQAQNKTPRTCCRYTLFPGSSGILWISAVKSVLMHLPVSKCGDTTLKWMLMLHFSLA